MAEANLIDRINRAVQTLSYKDPVFGLYFTLLKLTEREEGISTLATDCDKLYFNPKYVSELTDDELRAVLSHEVMHCLSLTAGDVMNRLQDFIDRGDDRYPDTKKVSKMARSTIANWASDYQINSIIQQTIDHLPKGVLVSNEMNNKSLETILKEVLDSIKFIKSPRPILKPPKF